MEVRSRKQFLDRAFEPDDLAALVEMLSAWFHVKPGRDGGDPIPWKGQSFLRAEMRVWGFPHTDAAAVRDGLAARLDALGFPASLAQVVVADPETVAVRSQPVIPTSPPDFAPWVAALTGGGEGIPEHAAVELRLTLNDAAAERGPKSGRGNTFVLFGAVHRDRLTLKGIYTAGRDGTGDRIYRYASWAQEAKLTAALYDWKTGASRAVPKWAPMLFVAGGDVVLNALVQRYVNAPKRGFAGWLRRGLFGAAATFLLLWGAGTALNSGHVLTALLLLVAGVLMGLLWAVVLWWGFHSVSFLYRRMGEMNRRLYSAPAAFPEVRLEPDLADDPAVVKYTAELEAHGARYFRDVRTDPLPFDGSFAIRLFACPPAEGTTVGMTVIASTQGFRFFPARATFLVTTYLTDGWRVTTIGGESSGYQAPLPGVRLIVRVLPDADTPEAVLTAHRALVAQLAAQGRRPALLPAEGILPRLIAEHEEARPLKAAAGYFSLSDAFHQAFQIVRPAYREGAPLPPP